MFTREIIFFDYIRMSVFNRTIWLETSNYLATNSFPASRPVLKNELLASFVRCRLVFHSCGLFIIRVFLADTENLFLPMR